MKILITGITGFVGAHLAEYCLTMPEAEVYGTILSHHLGDEMKRIEKIKDKITLFECNLTNRIAVERVLQTVKPDKIFHLAAQSFVKVSWDGPEDTIFNNIMSELNILESCRSLGINPVVQIAGSSEEYGLVLENELPIKETNPLRPLSPYAVSKIGQEMLGYQYCKSYGLKIILTRAFNHAGPGRGEMYAESAFAKQIVECELGRRKVVEHGNGKSDLAERERIRLHEEQHALKAFFEEKFSSSAEEAAWQEFFTATSRAQAEQLFERFLRIARQQEEEYARDEILACFKDGAHSAEDILDKLAKPAEEGGVYDFLARERGYIGAWTDKFYTGREYGEWLRGAAKKAFGEEYHNVLKESIDAFERLRYAGYSTAQAIALLIHEPLSRWKKVVDRQLGGASK